MGGGLMDKRLSHRKKAAFDQLIVKSVWAIGRAVKRGRLQGMEVSGEIGASGGCASRPILQEASLKGRRPPSAKLTCGLLCAAARWKLIDVKSAQFGGDMGDGRARRHSA